MIQLRYGGRECGEGKNCIKWVSFDKFYQEFNTLCEQRWKKNYKSKHKTRGKKESKSVEKNTHIFTKENVRRN